MQQLRWGVIGALLAAVAVSSGQPARSAPPTHGTFSIIAYDPSNGDIGIAISSRVLAVGAETAWAETGVGGVVTQALANVTYGPKGLDLLRQGKSASAVLEALLADDEQREQRQAAVVDVKGRIAQHTGEECLNWAGGVTGEHYAAQGNILVDEQVVQAMGKAFEEARGQLADRLMAALEAGQAAGGDRRGRQSAHILVVREGGGYLSLSDRYIDLRVDDSSRPVKELRRILNIELSWQAMLHGWRLRQKGKVDECINHLHYALTKYPGSPFLYYDLACAYAVNGNSDAAFRYLSLAIDKRPDAKGWARGDDELESLHDDPRWADLVGEEED